MKYKKILIATILLLAILSVGAVSASQDADVIAQDLDEVVSEDIAVGNDLGAVVDEDNLTQPSRYEYLNNSTIDEEPADGPTTILEVYGTEYMPIGYDNDLVFSIIVSGDEKSGKWKPVDELSDEILYLE